MKIHMIILVGAMWLGGCAALPETLQVENQGDLVSYPQVAQNADSTKDKFARWGGVVVAVENKPDTSVVEMVHYPIRSYGRPVTSQESIGRFRVYVKGFLDPLVFEQGRSVTFAGQVTGVEEGAVGEQKYMYPTIAADGYHLWKNIETVDISTIHIWPYSYWNNWYGFPHHRRHTIVTRRISGNEQSGGQIRTRNVQRQRNQGHSGTTNTSRNNSSHDTRREER